MTDVLISYARRDRGVAARLAASLAERGLKAVWDISELPEGELLSAARQRLQAAPVVIVLWSEASVSAPWVNEEANFAISRDALVSASVDGTPSPVATKHPSVDLADWNAAGAEAGLDALIKAIAEAAQLAESNAATQSAQATADQAMADQAMPAQTLPAVRGEPGLPTTMPDNSSGINDGAPPGEPAAVAAFIIIAFLTLLGVAVARKDARTPADLPPISMDATEPLDVPVIAPTPEEENAPSGLRPIPVPSQDSTGSVRK